MFEVALPDDSDVSELTRSFAACLASALEVPVGQLPLRPMDLSLAVSRWRSWLAGKGVGIVPIARPADFTWPGFWIAVLDGGPDEAGDDVAVLMFGTPSGVVLSPQDPGLLGRSSSDLPVNRGFVVSNFDPALPAPAAPPKLRGGVEAIAIAERAMEPMRLVREAQALAGHGLAGDRYAAKAGTFTPRDGAGSGYDLTLIQAEVLDDLRLPDGGHLDYAQARRNIVTRGIDVNELVGRRFRIGQVECLGQRLCEPCSHLEALTGRGVLRGLIHRGGLRADILAGGRIATGSVIETLD